MIEIEVCERLMDRTWDGKPKFHAQIKGESAYWSCSDHPYGAIGDLVATHPEKFGITITYKLQALPR